MKDFTKTTSRNDKFQSNFKAKNHTQTMLEKENQNETSVIEQFDQTTLDTSKTKKRTETATNYQCDNVKRGKYTYRLISKQKDFLVDNSINQDTSKSRRLLRFDGMHKKKAFKMNMCSSGLVKNIEHEDVIAHSYNTNHKNHVVYRTIDCEDVESGDLCAPIKYYKQGNIDMVDEFSLGSCKKLYGYETRGILYDDLGAYDLNVLREDSNHKNKKKIQLENSSLKDVDEYNSKKDVVQKDIEKNHKDVDVVELEDLKRHQTSKESKTYFFNEYIDMEDIKNHRKDIGVIDLEALNDYSIHENKDINHEDFRVNDLHSLKNYVAFKNIDISKIKIFLTPYSQEKNNFINNQSHVQDSKYKELFIHLYTDSNVFKHKNILKHDYLTLFNKNIAKRNNTFLCYNLDEKELITRNNQNHFDVQLKYNKKGDFKKGGINKIHKFSKNMTFYSNNKCLKGNLFIDKLKNDQINQNETYKNIYNKNPQEQKYKNQKMLFYNNLYGKNTKNLENNNFISNNELNNNMSVQSSDESISYDNFNYLKDEYDKIIVENKNYKACYNSNFKTKNRGVYNDVQKCSQFNSKINLNGSINVCDNYSAIEDYNNNNCNSSYNQNIQVLKNDGQQDKKNAYGLEHIKNPEHSESYDISRMKSGKQYSFESNMRRANLSQIGAEIRQEYKLSTTNYPIAKKYISNCNSEVVKGPRSKQSMLNVNREIMRVNQKLSIPKMDSMDSKRTSDYNINHDNLKGFHRNLKKRKEVSNMIEPNSKNSKSIPYFGVSSKTNKKQNLNADKLQGKVLERFHDTTFGFKELQNAIISKTKHNDSHEFHDTNKNREKMQNMLFSDFKRGQVINSSKYNAYDNKKLLFSGNPIPNLNFDSDEHTTANIEPIASNVGIKVEHFEAKNNSFYQYNNDLDHYKRNLIKADMPKRTNNLQIGNLVKCNEVKINGRYYTNKANQFDCANIEHVKEYKKPNNDFTIDENEKRMKIEDINLNEYNNNNEKNKRIDYFSLNKPLNKMIIQGNQEELFKNQKRSKIDIYKNNNPKFQDMYEKNQISKEDNLGARNMQNQYLQRENQKRVKYNLNQRNYECKQYANSEIKQKRFWDVRSNDRKRLDLQENKAYNKINTSLHGKYSSEQKLKAFSEFYGGVQKIKYMARNSNCSLEVAHSNLHQLFMYFGLEYIIDHVINSCFRSFNAASIYISDINYKSIYSVAARMHPKTLINAHMYFISYLNKSRNFKNLFLPFHILMFQCLNISAKYLEDYSFDLDSIARKFNINLDELISMEMKVFSNLDSTMELTYQETLEYFIMQGLVNRQTIDSAMNHLWTESLIQHLMQIISIMNIGEMESRLYINKN